MTDLLTVQAQIKSRHHPKESPSRDNGRFAVASLAAETKAAIESRTILLRQELGAWIHVRPHFRGDDVHLAKPLSDAVGDPDQLPLFEIAA